MAALNLESGPRLHDAPGLDWAVAGSALGGASTSGDLHLVLPGSSTWLLCVMDGLGHGQDAARAASECSLVLSTHADAPLLDLVRYCHEGLRSTRGVAMTLAQIDVNRGDLAWVAVGNVEGLVLRPGTSNRRAHAAVVQRGGVVGYRLPPLKLSHVALAHGDVILFATDGIKGGFHEGLDLTASTRELCDDIARRFTKGSDDALVLAARYQPESTAGGGP